MEPADVAPDHEARGSRWRLSRKGGEGVPGPGTWAGRVSPTRDPRSTKQRPTTRPFFGWTSNIRRQPPPKWPLRTEHSRHLGLQPGRKLRAHPGHIPGQWSAPSRCPGISTSRDKHYRDSITALRDSHARAALKPTTHAAP